MNISICGKGIEKGSEFIGMLGNAPALKILSLRDYNLTLLDLKSIYSKAPLLTSLPFYATRFKANIYPAAVSPTNAIIELNLADLYISNNQEYLTFQKYVTQKYLKVTDMEYSVNLYLTDALRLLEEGCIPQLQRIASTLTSLNLKQSQYIPFTFPALDQRGCQLKELTIGLPLSEEDVIIITTYPGAKTLILREFHLLYNTCSFIPKIFPELQNLIIYYCSFNISLFDSGELNLSYLGFRDPIPPNQRHILIEMRHDNQKR